MRVTKTVREYIEKEVTARMERKYADEAAEAKHQHNLYEKIEAEALRAAAQAYEAAVERGIKENHAEGLLGISKTFPEGVQLSYAYRSNRIQLTHENEATSVLRWRRRMQEEAEEKCEEIIVTLELGGTKAELMEMLSKI